MSKEAMNIQTLNQTIKTLEGLRNAVGSFTRADVDLTLGMLRREQEALAEQPAQQEPLADSAFLERVLSAMEGVIDVADRKTNEFDVLRACIVDLTLMLHLSQPAQQQQEPQTSAQERTEFEQFWVDELGEADELTYGKLGYAIRRVDVAWEAWKAGKISANHQTIVGRKVWIDWKAQALELRELVRLNGIKIAELKSAQPAQQEPVALLPVIDVCMRAEAHGIDPQTKGLYGFYVDCISSSPQPAQPQQEPVAFEIAYARALKESNSGTLKDIAKLCYQAALIVQSAAPVSQKPSWYHKHWGDGDDIFYTPTGRIPEGATPLYTSPPASKPLTPEWYARWIRNNYQDHWNIATLCDEMTKAANGTKGDA